MTSSKSNEPLKVIKQKTERLSQRLFIGRSNIEANVPKSVSHSSCHLSQEGAVSWWGGNSSPSPHTSRPDEGPAVSPRTTAYSGLLLFHSQGAGLGAESPGSGTEPAPPPPAVLKDQGSPLPLFCLLAGGTLIHMDFGLQHLSLRGAPLLLLIQRSPIPGIPK